MLLKYCNGCQNQVTSSLDPIEHNEYPAIVEPIDSLEKGSLERADTIGHVGKLKITLLWDFPGDIDLHVEQPNGFEINYNQGSDSQTGGCLDVDNKEGGVGSVENIYWENPPHGEYVVSLVYFARVDGVEGGTCTVVIMCETNGTPRVESFQVDMRTANEKEKVYITRFTTREKEKVYTLLIR